MDKVAVRGIFRAWHHGDIRLETHRPRPGILPPAVPHLHEQYELAMPLVSPGQCVYRGVRAPIPVRSLCLFHPGEVHAAGGADALEAPGEVRMMFVPPSLLQEAAVAEPQGGGGASLPFFPEAVQREPGLTRRFLHLHRTLETSESALESDSLLLSFLARLADQCAAAPPVRRERAAVRQVRDYLHDNFDRSVSLEELARLTGRSRFALLRAFRRETGLPPHAYQIAVRVARAKALLARGVPAGEVAMETGFSSHSHFIAHFKRLVTVTPGQYVAGL